MITREQIEEAFGDNRESFKTKNIDHDFVAISLLRDRIPYDKCKNIIVAAEHDSLYLCQVDKALPYLDEDDLGVLADCNVVINDDNDCLFLFV